MTNHRVRTGVAWTLLVGASTAFSAGQTSPFEDAFIFGTISTANSDTFFDSGVAVELGGGIYFNEWIGLFGAIHRSPGGTRDPHPFYMIDNDNRWFPAWGQVVASAFNSVGTGILLKKRFTQTIHVFTKLGLHYFTYEVDAFAKVDRSGFSGDLMETFSNEGSGKILSLGVGFRVSENIDVALAFTYFATKLEDYIYVEPPKFTIREPLTPLPLGYSIALHFNF